MKVVLDTNVLVSAFASRGLCEAVVELCLANHDVVLSEYILSELNRHLVGKVKLTRVRASEIVSFLREHAFVVEPAPVPSDACRDANDRPILGTALAAGADCLVTGDADLLSLRQFGSIPILSPREFYDSLR